MAAKGILGTKIGMTQVFDDEARVLPVTVVKAGPCPVVAVRTPERDGYSALQLGFGEAKRATKPLAGHFAKAGVEPTRHLVEIRLDAAPDAELGSVLGVDQFLVGELVDVSGTSKGKGFAGAMKRHGFSGMGAGHGAHKVHRAPGAIGACATPGRVFPGTRMAGHMGNERVTVQSLEVVAVDAERNLLLIKGAVPGPRGGLLTIRNASKAAPVAAPAGDAA